VNKLKVRSCLIDGEAVCCNERGVASFDKLRHRSHDPEVFLVAFDLLELDGQDLRREPLLGSTYRSGRSPDWQWQTGRAYRAFRSLETTEAPQRMKIAPLLVGAV
jgi:hypothetical protein